MWFNDVGVKKWFPTKLNTHKTKKELRRIYEEKIGISIPFNL